MSKMYEKYFGRGDIDYGQTKIMRDIRDHALSGSELRELIDELEHQGMLTSKRYTPQPQEMWDKEYLDKLSNGHLSDYFSRDFLEHFGKAAEYVFNRKRARNRKFIAAGVILLALALAVGYWLISSGGNSGKPAEVNTSIQSSQN